MRNNSYGSRSEKGESVIAVLMSVKQTCKTKNGNFLDVMRAYLIKTCQKPTYCQFMCSTVDEVLSLKRETPKNQDLKRDEDEPEQPNKIQADKCLKLLRQP